VVEQGSHYKGRRLSVNDYDNYHSLISYTIISRLQGKQGMLTLLLKGSAGFDLHSSFFEDVLEDDNYNASSSSL
jgi:hypothetical protein